MVMLIKDNGLMVLLQVLEFIYSIMVQFNKDIGNKIYSMGMDSSNGLMKAVTKVNTKLVKNKALESINGLMEVTTKVSGKIICKNMTSS